MARSNGGSVLSKTKKHCLLIDRVRQGDASLSDKLKFQALLGSDPEFAVLVQQSDDSLGLLSKERYCDIEHDPVANARISRIARIGLNRKTVDYWSPALIGAVTAAVGFIAILQILAYQPTDTPAAIGDAKAELSTPNQELLPNYTESGR